jgi:hypothetical protein
MMQARLFASNFFFNHYKSYLKQHIQTNGGGQLRDSFHSMVQLESRKEQIELRCDSVDNLDSRQHQPRSEEESIWHVDDYC